jgi:pimeloyl-ACP methyl ester carboxylesterase
MPSFRSPAEEAAKNKAESVVKEEALSKTTEAAKVETKAPKALSQKPAIVFISGLQMMYSPSKSEGSYAGLGRIAETVEGARMYGWEQADEILEHIATTHPSQPVVLVGHSLGGDTAVDIANRLDSLEHGFRKVDLLVSLDAVGFNNDIIPQNVKEHLNVFGESDWILNDGPHVARRHDKTQVKNILSPLDHTELDDAKDVQFEIVSSIKARLGRPA